MKNLRRLLLPLSFLYRGVLWLRNFMYNTGILKSYNPAIKTICIGNIALGGTGKTPHIEYILQLIAHKNTAVLSRGYGRKSNDTIIVTSQSNTNYTGDEPLQIARKFPNTKVVVDGNRLRGIAFIKKQFPDTDIILLDDAFQHRKLKAGLNILLTTFDQPFTSDYYLPAGNLRDHKIRAKQADVIVVTKCPDDLNAAEVNAVKDKLRKYSPRILFDKIAYKKALPVFESLQKSVKDYQKVFLISGIAKPGFFRNKAEKTFNVIKHFNFRDHYQFTLSDLERFRNFIGSFAPGEICALTTEKDAMRMLHLLKNSSPDELPLFYWEIGINMGNYKTEFDNLILNYVEQT